MSGSGVPSRGQDSAADATGDESGRAHPNEGTSARGFSRRQFLGLAGLGTLTLGLGGAGGFALGQRRAGDGVDSSLMAKSYPLRGDHQQGVLTPAQQQMHTAAFDLVIDSATTSSSCSATGRSPPNA